MTSKRPLRRRLPKLETTHSIYFSLQETVLYSKHACPSRSLPRPLQRPHEIPSVSSAGSGHSSTRPRPGLSMGSTLLVMWVKTMVELLRKNYEVHCPNSTLPFIILRQSQRNVSSRYFHMHVWLCWGCTCAGDSVMLGWMWLGFVFLELSTFLVSLNIEGGSRLRRITWPRKQLPHLEFPCPITLPSVFQSLLPCAGMYHCGSSVQEKCEANCRGKRRFVKLFLLDRHYSLAKGKPLMARLMSSLDVALMRITG